MGTGQSVSIGMTSLPAISLSQPYNNYHLGTTLIDYARPLTPLIEQGQESPSSGTANSLHAMDSLSRDIVLTEHGSSGSIYIDLKRGTGPWARMLAQVKNTKAEADSMGLEYKPIAVTVIHGEHDNYYGNAPLYQGFLEEWHHDYNHDIDSVTNTPHHIRLFVNQFNSGWDAQLGVAQLNAHRDNPGEIVLVGPKYFYHYSDGMHMTNIESKHMGEMMAKVINKVCYKGETWNPLMPLSVIRHDSSLTVDFHIPVGALEFDTSRVAPRPNYGFEFFQTGGDSIWITGVELVNNATQVQVHLSGIPNGTDPRLRYAYSCRYPPQGMAWCGGGMDTLSVGGNLRDQDSSVSPAIDATGIPFYNWCVAFDEPVQESLGIASTPYLPAMTVHPNPTSGDLNVKWPKAAGDLQVLRLHDLSGRLVRDWQFGGGNALVRIRLEGLPAGMYWLDGEGEGGLRLGCRVLVQ